MRQVHDTKSLISNNSVNYLSYIFSKRNLKILILLVFLLIIFQAALSPQKIIDSTQIISERFLETKPEKQINILFWKPRFGTWYGYSDERGEVTKQALEGVNCPKTNCFWTHDKNYTDGDYTKFDAIIFNSHEPLFKILPTRRSPHQLYIFSTEE